MELARNVIGWMLEHPTLSCVLGIVVIFVFVQLMEIAGKGKWER
jgi:hypothetical protein